MADEDEFEFKDEEEAPTGWGGVPETPEEAPEMLEEAPPMAKRSLLRRLLPLGALLVALAAAGLYFTLGGPESEEERVETVEMVRQAIPIAPKPSILPSAGEEKKGVAPKRGILMEIVEEDMRAEPVPAAVKEAPAASVPPLPEAKTKAKATMVARAEGSKFALAGGAFLLESTRKEAEEKVRRLGYSFRVEPLKKTVGMTRLRTGVYPPGEARAKLEELKKSAPDAFLIGKGDKIALYAASYFDLDKARRYAEELYGKGISVEEEGVRMEVNLALLTYGAFQDRASALEAAEEARALGLEAQVLTLR